MSKIAIMVDSGCDISLEVQKERGIYVIPLKINYSNGTFRDGVDITPQEVYARLEQEIPKTSLPSGEEILEVIRRIQADGFEKILGVHISSNLSGTFNIIRLVAEELRENEGLDIRLIDTKNIANGAGFLGLYAQDLVDAGFDMDEIEARVTSKITHTSAYFCVDTLKYLEAGGRIGHVASFLGTKLNLKPVVSCDEEGIYHTVAKVRGKKQALSKIVSLGQEFIGDAKDYDICISQGCAYDEIAGFEAEVLNAFPNAKTVYRTEISPTLGVHTGPGLLGLGVFYRD